MALNRLQGSLFADIRAKSLPYLPSKINFKELEFLKNKDTVAVLIRVIDELEKQRQGTVIEDDKRYRKNLLEHVIEADLLPILKRHSLIKVENNYYLLYDGEKKKAHIGKGHYGCVKYGINLVTGELAAIKIITQSATRSANSIIREGKDESQRLAKANRLLGSFPSISPNKQQQFHIIQKLVQSPTLDAFNTSAAGLYERFHAFFQVCKTVDELHSRGIIHGDLSVYNIMYNPEDGTVDLIDFGLSRELPFPEYGYREHPASRENDLANRENAPEIFEPKGIFSIYSDIFNLGRIAGHTFALYDAVYQLPTLHSADFDNMTFWKLHPELHTSIHLVVKKMQEPIATLRSSLKEVMLELEKILRRVAAKVAANPTMRENVGIVNIKQYLLNPDKKASFDELLNFINRIRIKRIILIDPCNDDINDEHIALIKLLEQKKIVVHKKIYFIQNLNGLPPTEMIITDHFKTLGMLFNYHYYAFGPFALGMINDYVNSFSAYNDRLAKLYSQVMNLKHRRKLLSESKSLGFRQQSETLSGECADLRKLAKELGQTDLLLQKLEKILTKVSVRSSTPRLLFTPENKTQKTNGENTNPKIANDTKFYLVCKDGFFTTIYSHTPNIIKKVNCVFTDKLAIVHDKTKLLQYRGPVHPSAYIKVDDKTLRSVVRNVEIIRPTSACDATKLLNAVKNGEYDVVLQYIDQNRDILTTDATVCAYLSAALQWAAWSGYYQLVKILMTTPGVDINYMSNGETALTFAAIFGYLNIVNLLITQGADVNLVRPTGNGNSALIFSAIRGHAKVVKALLSAGAKVNYCNKEGDNALLSATKYGHTEVVVELLKAPDLNPTIKRKDGLNALKIAHKHNYPEITHLLSDSLSLTPANPIRRRAI